MTTKAQFRKAALGLPEAREESGPLPVYTVRGTMFAALADGNQAELHLPDTDLAEALERYPTASRSGQQAIRLPLTDIGGMQLNSLVYRAWLQHAPADLAESARAAKAVHGEDEDHSLPAGIGRPAARALLLAGMKSLEDVADRTEEELLALHGVGPRAVRLLGEALSAHDLTFREPDSKA